MSGLRCLRASAPRRRPGMVRRTARCAVWVLAALPACVSLERGGIYPEDRDEVFVGFFDNRTFYRDVQFELTDQIVNEILSRPGLHLTSKDLAEVELSGRVMNVHQTVLSEDPTRNVTSAATIITVEIEVRDTRTGEVIKTRRLTQQGEYVPGFGQDVDEARREAYVFLARDIVRELEKEF